MANKYARGGTPFHDELLQEARLDLCDAALRFDRKHGTKFTSFAFPYAFGRVRHFLRDDHVIMQAKRWARQDGVPLKPIWSLEYLKHEMRRDDGSGESMVWEPSALDPELAHVEDRMLVDQTLAQLPSVLRLVAVVVCDGWTQAEAARILGIKQETVNRRLLRVRQHLRRPSNGTGACAAATSAQEWRSKNHKTVTTPDS